MTVFWFFQLKAPVKGFLPADEPATRKNPLYRSIFDGFDKIDGKPTEAERKVGNLLLSNNHVHFKVTYAMITFGIVNICISKISHAVNLNISRNS